MPDDLDILLRRLKDLKERHDSGALAEAPYRDQVARVLSGEEIPQTLPSDQSRAGALLVLSPLGNAANSFVGPVAEKPQSPLERAFEEARKAEVPLTHRSSRAEPGPSAAPAGTTAPGSDPQLGRAQPRGSYWDRSTRVVAALPLLEDDLGDTEKPVASYWSRGRRYDQSA